MKGAYQFFSILVFFLGAAGSTAENTQAAKDRGKSTSQLLQATSTFKECLSYKDLKPRMSCLDKLISAELEPSLRGKLLVWLAEIESIDGKLLVCEKQQVESLTLAKADFQYSCGSLKMKSGLASVVLAFSSHPKVDGLRLVNIHH